MKCWNAGLDFDLFSLICRFVLNTSIEYPHEKGINSLEFQSSSNALDLLCATSGNDEQFKIWSLADTTNIYRKTLNIIPMECRIN